MYKIITSTAVTEYFNNFPNSEDPRRNCNSKPRALWYIGFIKVEWVNCIFC